MKSKKLGKKSAKSRTAGLKAGAVSRVKALGISRNHNETLVHNS